MTTTHSTDPPESLRWLTTALLAANRVITRVFHRVSIESRPWALPDTGSAIVVANHTSPLDPLLIQSQTRRHIRWMMAGEYLDLPLTRSVWPATGVIPVARDGRDSAGARAALRVLHKGGVLGIFPEGRISPTADLLPLEPGVGLLATKSRAPIYPVWIDGTQRETGMTGALLIPQAATLRFGAPVRCDEGAQPGRGHDVMLRLVEALEALRPSAR